MSEGGGESLLVRHFCHKAKIPLGLRPVTGKTGFSKTLKLPESPKHAQPVRVWGKSEVQKIERLPPGHRKEFILKEIKDLSCLILSEGLPYPHSVMLAAREKKIVLFVTKMAKRKCQIQLKKLIASFQSQQQILPGGLLKIFGCGVLISGDSGVGKSECALELISRGHLFVSDDVVLINKVADQRLVGSAASLSRNFMEIRGLGIINIKRIFGEKSVSPHANIDLLIMLKKWKEGKEYDRLGLKIPESLRFLGVDIPKITIPVAPGRNISTLIEVACKLFLLKQGGYHAAQDLTKKLDRALAAR